jgi:thiol-disulfide isomerase/thioredoxin
MYKLFFALFLALVFIPVTARAQHEYAPVQDKAVNYKNWTLPGLTDRKLVNLRTWAQDKKLVMVVYFAPWCGNWKFNAPVVAKLYEKYKAQGLGVVAVSEYGSLEETRNFFGPNGPPYPVVTESETRDDRKMTAHFGYRQLTGDGRNWGSPWHIFLEPAKFPASGDVLAANAMIVNGELIEDEADKFIAGKLAQATPAMPSMPAGQKNKPTFSSSAYSAKPALVVENKDAKKTEAEACPVKP